MRKARIILPILLLGAIIAYLVFNSTAISPATKPFPTRGVVSVTKTASPITVNLSVPAEALSAQIQKEFSKKYGKPADTYIVRVQKSSGTYAKGSIDFKDEAGGGLWFAAKTDAGWELVFDGNGIMDCATADKYQMPAEYVSGCVDVSKGNEFVERR